MKLKIIVKLLEKALGMADSGEARADMYMPDRALAMAIVYLAGGSVCAILAFITQMTWAIVCAPLLLGLAVSVFLCWKNQSIRVISDEEFAYTTMFGNTYTYRFADIQGLRKNKDSMTLFVAGKKVHMESMAILSENLVNRINQAL